jgi:hypothetical protein
MDTTAATQPSQAAHSVRSYLIFTRSLKLARRYLRDHSSSRPDTQTKVTPTGYLRALNTLLAVYFASGGRSAGPWHFQERGSIITPSATNKQKIRRRRFLAEQEPKYEHREQVSGQLTLPRTPSPGLSSRMLVFCM